MPNTWQTDEVLRCLADADQDEIHDLLDEAGDEAAEALQEWVREGNAPKSLYDSVMRFTTNSNLAFGAVDWETVATRILHGQ